jgi:hypothetical protein
MAHRLRVDVRVTTVHRLVVAVIHKEKCLTKLNRSASFVWDRNKGRQQQRESIEASGKSADDAVLQALASLKTP